MLYLRASTSQEGSFLNLAKPQILHRHYKPTDHLSYQQNEAGIARELRFEIEIDWDLEDFPLSRKNDTERQKEGRWA